MALIRRMGRALIVAGALSLPALAAAEQAPSELCDGEKMKDPSAETADKRAPKQNADDKASKKADEKPEQKPEPKDSDKS